MTNLNGKVALVTGSARGLGRAVAERYGSLGASVVINYSSAGRQAREAVDAIERIGRRGHRGQGRRELASTTSNACSPKPSSGSVASTSSSPTPASNSSRHRPFDITEDDFDRLYAINAKGAFFTLQLRGQARRRQRPHHLHRHQQHPPTRYPGYALYGSSKMGAQFVVEVLAKELGARGVAVNSILPTAIDGAGVFTDGVTDQVRSSSHPIRPMASAWEPLDDVADAAEYLASDLAGFVSGQHLLISGGAPA